MKKLTRDGAALREGPAEIVPTLLAAHTLPPEFAERRGEYVRWIAEDLIPEVAAAKLAQYCDVFCDEAAFTVQEAYTVLTAAVRTLDTALDGAYTRV